MSNIANLVKKARIDAELTQIEAIDKFKAKGLEVNQSKLSRIENGEYKMPSEWITVFARVYKVNPLKLLLTEKELEESGYIDLIKNT